MRWSTFQWKKSLSVKMGEALSEGEVWLQENQFNEAWTAGRWKLKKLLSSSPSWNQLLFAKWLDFLDTCNLNCCCDSHCSEWSVVWQSKKVSNPVLTLCRFWNISLFRPLSTVELAFLASCLGQGSCPSWPQSDTCRPHPLAVMLLACRWSFTNTCG